MTESGDGIYGQCFHALSNAKEVVMIRYGRSGKWVEGSGYREGERGYDYMSGETLVGTVFFAEGNKDEA